MDSIIQHLVMVLSIIIFTILITRWQDKRQRIKQFIKKEKWRLETTERLNKLISDFIDNIGTEESKNEEYQPHSEVLPKKEETVTYTNCTKPVE